MCGNDAHEDGTHAIARTTDVCAGRMAIVSDDSSGTEAGGIPDVVSLAARQVRRRRADFARAGAAAELADLVALETVLAEADALIADTDDSDVTHILRRAAAKDQALARLGDVMARITADDQAASAAWRSLASAGTT
jgi:hypothetical protein